MAIATKVLNSNDVYRECELEAIDVYYDVIDDTTTYLFDDGSAVEVADHNQYRRVS